MSRIPPRETQPDTHRSAAECAGKGCAGHWRQAPSRGLCLALLLLGTAMLAGCSGMRRQNTTVYVLSIHEHGRADLIPGRSLQYLTSYDGRERIAVRRMPIITSHAIASATVLDTDAETGLHGIRCYVDRHGSNLWLQACRTMPGATVAVVVDGFYRFSTQLPTRLSDTTAFDLRGPWSRDEAEKIAAEAENNYSILSGNKTMFAPDW